MLVTLAAGLFVLLVLGSLFMLAVGNPFIDWLDARTSRMTSEEASRRAKLAIIGKWPVVHRPWRRPLEWVILIIGLTLMGLVTMGYRYLMR